MHELIVFCLGDCNTDVSATKYVPQWMSDCSTYPILFIKKSFQKICWILVDNDDDDDDDDDDDELFCGTVEWRKAFSLSCSRDDC